MRKLGPLLIFFLLLSWNPLFAQRFGLTKEEETDRKEEAIRQQQIMTEQQQAQSLTGGMEAPIDPQQYILGPGDAFAIFIFANQSLQYQAEVGPAGYLMVPSVGKINVRSKTLQQAEKELTALIQAKYKVSTVNINLTRVRLISCFVSGAVAEPGKYNIRAIDRAFDLINKAGGLTDRAYPYNVTLIPQSGDTVQLDLMEFMRSGNLEHNPVLKAGDRIIVPTANITDQVVLVRTGFENQGLYPLKPGQTVQQFLDYYETYVRSVDVNQATIFRQGETEPIVLDLYANEGSFHLLPGDEIELETIRGVTVNGFVYEPGRFSYQPDFTVADYIALAGGVTPAGALNRTEVIHQDGTRESGTDLEVRRGDKIIVPESRRSVFVGDISVLEIVTSVASVVLTYIAATQ